MTKAIDDALLDFYQQLLKPEFDAIRATLDEHRDKLDEICRLMEKAEQRFNYNDINREV
ncbi:hypothetical protein [Geomonas oryzae]|uniref:hypothetical protein n=1 Tax=Geomonas oryzae TaxID=2364273 RepID=UPI0013A5C514|nr:hypothetical protein [Geomonas oryzae]